MAPICTPGHTDPSQDLLEEVRAVERWGTGGVRQKDGCGLLG